MTHSEGIYQTIDGTSGLKIEDVAHVLVPGRGRNEYGDGLSCQSFERVNFAASFFIEQELEIYGGVIVPSGYKTPPDRTGEPWTAPDEDQKTYVGLPEAESMKRILLSRKIGETAVRVERDSFDTATNFVYAENGGYFPDDRPVAIVAQERHLERMLKIIAPKTLRREYIGIVVPEGEVKDGDRLAAKIQAILAMAESYYVLRGINPDSTDIIDETTKRANKAWSMIGTLPLNKFK